jgi:Uma2 family endonuclease
MRLHIPATGSYTYPDVSVVCGPPVFHDTDNLENPIVLVDASVTKFFDYKSIPSLKEYLLVSPELRRITHCTRLQGTDWRIETLGPEQQTIRLPSINVELSFDRIYEGAESLP